MKKTISTILIAALLCNICPTEVHAKETGETVYIDGVEFEVSITENFEIQVKGNSELSDAILTISEGGIGNVQIENEFVDSEEYSLEIEELSKKDIDIDIYEEDAKIEEISSVDEIYEDEYEGQMEILVSGGGILITLGMLLEALLTVLLASLLAVVIAGVLYIVATKLYEIVESASTEVKERVKKYYYRAAIYKGQVVVSTVGISKSQAISRVKNNLSVYSFTSTMAKAVITQAGFSCSKPEIDQKRYKGHVYLYHYHKATKNGSPLHAGGFHSFYGKPVVGTL